VNDATWRLVTVLGGAAVVVGLILGFSSMSVPTLDGARSCGSAFSSAHFTAEAGSTAAAECASKRHDRSTTAWSFLIAGGIVGIFAIQRTSWTWRDVIGPSRRPEESSDPPPTVQS
jgi:hypothetical protein